MDEIRRNNPKGFWNFFKKKKSTTSGLGDIPLDQFFEHFRDLSSSKDQNGDEEVEDFLRDFDNNQGQNGGGSTFGSLDENIYHTKKSNDA